MKKVFQISCFALIVVSIINADLAAQRGSEDDQELLSQDEGGRRARRGGDEGGGARERRGGGEGGGSRARRGGGEGGGARERRGGSEGGGARARRGGGEGGGTRERRGGGGEGGGARESRRGGRGSNRNQTMQMRPSRPSRPDSSRRLSAENRIRGLQRNRSRRQDRNVGFRNSSSSSRREVRRFLSSRRGSSSGKQIRSANRRNFANRRNRALSIRVNVRNRWPNNSIWFRSQFWNNHFNPWGGYTNVNWWIPATWGSAASWVGWRSVQPIFFDEGFVYYPPDFNQAETAVAPPNRSSGDWMPLGVFALMREGEDQDTNPTLFLQLALNRDGTIGGTFYNALTDTTYPVEGELDQDTQEVAWIMSESDQAPIFETGLYNLTQSETPVMVYFANGTTQAWFMVRLDQPPDL